MSSGQSRIGCRAAYFSSIAALATALCAGEAAAQQRARVLAEPPALQERAAPGAEAAPVDDGETVLDLNIVYTDGQIYNPNTKGYDKVRLRSYTGTGVDPAVPFISPSIHVKPGHILRVNLNNQLPADPSCAPGDQAAPDVPHCFNGTNLHTHGLWVNPSGNGDNVLLTVHPGQKFEYEYAIPPTHPAGTFWYHTHRHGSTALQVSSGMAGALIIHGDRLPTATDPGDIDTLLRGYPDRTMVLQQIQYACLDENGNIKQTPSGAYICGKDKDGKEDVGVIENYDGFGPSGWSKSGRYTSINGLVLPEVDAVQGRLERWRLIHGGVRDTISLTFVKAREDPRQALGAGSGPDTVKDLLGKTCDGATLDYHVIAADGLTLAKPLYGKQTVYQPGYRFDSLVVFPEEGTYCMIDASVTGAGTVGGSDLGPKLLGIVKVAKGKPVPDIPAFVRDELVRSAEKAMSPSRVRDTVVKDLRDRLQLTRFVAHKTVPKSEVTGTQELTFFIDTRSANTYFGVGGKGYEPRPYVADRLDRKLPLGGVDEWTLRSAFVSHPFHIHVNPFQVVEIRDPWGRDVSDPSNPDTYPIKPDAKGAKADPQYAGLKDAWKDTLWVKSIIGTGAKIPPQTDGMYTIKVRTRYQRYIGEFVLHCHILDHEDQGMMQNVAVVIPGGSADSVNAASGDGHSH